MQNCNHENTQYVRRTFPDGTVHYGIQCLDCLDIIKTDRHEGKLFIKHNEIPAGSVIHDWVNPCEDQGDLFND